MQLDLRSAVLRLHNDHAISVPADAQSKILKALEALQAEGRLTRAAVLELSATVSSEFLKRNEFETPSQYGQLLWEAASTASPQQHLAPTSTTHFHAPVQAGILQTGAMSSAHWTGNQQTLAFGESFLRALAEAKRAAVDELDASHRDQGVAIIEAAQTEAKKAQPDKGKIMRLLKPLATWTGGRFTAAIDAAIAAAVTAGVAPAP